MTLYENYSKQWAVYQHQMQSQGDSPKRKASAPTVAMLERGGEFRERRELNEMIQILKSRETSFYW